MVIYTDECGDRIPGDTRLVDHSMYGRLEHVVRPSGEQVTDIDDQRSGDRWCIYPLLVRV